MSSVVENKKKTLLEKIFYKIKPETLLHERRDIDCNIPLNDIRIDTGDTDAIALKRNELRTVKHGNSDAVITFNS